jgi:hypothetical protein
LPASEPFRLPRTSSGWSPRWLAASVAAHAVVLVVWSWSNVPRAVPQLGRAPLLVVDLAGQGRAPAPAPLVRYTAPLGGRSAAPVIGRGAAPVIGRDSAPAAGRGFAPVTDAAAGLPTGAGGRDSAGGTGRGTRGARTLASAVPEYGDGRLWVPPMYLPVGGGRPIRMDSVVAARMLALADSVERNPMADPRANPYVSRGWTFRRNGKTYGWDAAGLHLGDFTIPSVVLAFLSMPQGNIDLARANTALLGMRADIMRAAARAQTEDDFKQAVRDIRARKDRERREQRAREAARERLTP